MQESNEMILTFKKSDLIKKLTKAKADQIARIKKQNDDREAEWERERAAILKKGEAFLARVRAAKYAPKTEYYDFDAPSDTIRSYQKHEVCEDYDPAITLLEACSEESIEINSAHDKLGLADAVKKAVGGR